MALQRRSYDATPIRQDVGMAWIYRERAADARTVAIAIEDVIRL